MGELGWENRATERLEATIFAWVQGIADAEPQRAVIKDIGLGGAQVATRDLLKIRSLYTVQLDHPAGRSFKVRGIVRYSRVLMHANVVESGIEFLPETHEERVAIARYVSAVFGRPAQKAEPIVAEGATESEEKAA